MVAENNRQLTVLGRDHLADGVGHASAAMTLDTYADLFSDDLDAVADRLDQVVSKMWADLPQTEA